MELLRRLLVGLLGMIDSVVYDLVSWMYGLLMQITSFRMFTNENFADFAERIYVLLGLFMLFKVSFSLIKYIVNPDDFNDKVKGGKKLVINILVVLVMTVASPIAFRIMSDVEQTLLDEGVVEHLILGPNASSDNAIDGEMGEELKTVIFSSFYQLKPGADGSTVNAYTQAAGNHDINAMIHMEVNGEPLFMHKMPSGDEYAINYMFIISTVAGLFTAWIFLTFCIDIAIRTVKLGFLQLISPIPIISYIDPSSGKNGMFGKWLKEVGKTYADLFIRLAAVYFAIALIKIIVPNVTTAIGNVQDAVVRVFVIFGVLIFAGQVPKLIGELLGIKIEGNFSLNPMSKINTSPVAGAALGGVAGFLGGAVANTASIPGRIKDFKKAMDKEDAEGNRAGFTGAITDGNKFRREDGKIDWKGSSKAVASALRHAGSPFTGLAGAGSAMVRGAKAGSSGKGSAFGAGAQGITAASRARNARGGGYTAYDKFHDKFTDMAGLRSKTGTTSELGDRIKANQLEIANFKRDEQSYSQQLADISRANPAAFDQAFKEKLEYDSNGDVARDKDGKAIKTRPFTEYQTYFSSFAPEVTREEVESRAVHIQAERGYSNDTRGFARAVQEARDEFAINRGILTESQFNSYDTIYRKRDEADEAARKLEKRNKELQGYLDAKSGKPKG